MEPVREPPLLACTVKLTIPAPAPVAPPLMVIQPLALPASQWQPAPVVTLNEPVPPSTGYCQLLGLRANVQLDWIGGWVTVKNRPPAVITPARCAPLLLAATE